MKPHPKSRKDTRYSPAPLDTSNIQLEPQVEELIEQLAENTHEVWARQRVSDGWSYGPQRNDACKEHPCLVPYEELPEEEKNYDRVIVKQVIEGLFALGYHIEEKKPAHTK